MSLPPSEIPSGAMRFNSDSQKLEYYDGAQWLQVSTFSPLLNGGARGVFGGGSPGSPSAPYSTTSIDYINVSSTGNSQSFGNLQTARSSLSTFGSSTRGFWCGGRASGIANYNIIEYVTFSSTGDYTDFGDISYGASQGPFGLSNSTRGIIGGGSIVNNIDYVTMSSTGNSVTFGQTLSRGFYQSGAASPTRGFYVASLGQSPYPGQNIIEYITIAALGNATDFGDLTQTRASMASSSNATRGIFAGGYQPTITNTIDYITISTLGNAQNFGDLLSTTSDLNGNCTIPTRAVFAGGLTPTNTNVIQYIAIQTQGNSIDFGDLITPTGYKAGCSNAHGGL